MRVTKITYRRGLTLNIGEFESVRVDVEATAEVDDEETFADAYAALKDSVDGEVREEARAIRAKTRK